jgi:hypothetical protein
MWFGFEQTPVALHVPVTHVEKMGVHARPAGALISKQWRFQGLQPP